MQERRGHEFLLNSSLWVDIYQGGGGEALVAQSLLLCEGRAGMSCHLSAAHSSFDYKILNQIHADLSASIKQAISRFRPIKGIIECHLFCP